MASRKQVKNNEDPNLIVTLVARSTRTAEMWRKPHNQSFYVPPSFTDTRQSEQSGGDTPHQLSEDEEDEEDGEDGEDEDIEEKDDHEDVEPSLRLTFDKMPKSGFVFGSDAKICDIYLGSPDDHISGRQFLITFNSKGEIVLIGTTQASQTSVKYGIQKPGKRRKFTWILFSDRRTRIYVTVAKKLQFEVFVPRHGCFQAAYDALVAAHLSRRTDLMPPLNQLGIASRPETTVQTGRSTPSTKPFYYRREELELGRGTFGVVYMVRDVSDGQDYAAKQFFGEVNKAEVSILADLKHERIVQYIDFSEEDVPLLVMEYLQDGNLRNQLPLHEYETTALLYQGLQGLEYLHSQDVKHRDIKPENILIARRHPTLLIKLADFGLAKKGLVPESLCGTWEYVAPEIYDRRPYTYAIDIWSLGVIGFECLLCRLPRPSAGFRQGRRWCEDIVKRVQRFEVEKKDFYDDEVKDLVRIVASKMLRLEPRERLLAKECLKEGAYLAFLFTQNSMDSSKTPTQRSPKWGSSLSLVADGSKTPTQQSTTGGSSLHLASNEKATSSSQISSEASTTRLDSDPPYSSFPVKHFRACTNDQGTFEIAQESLPTQKPPTRRSIFNIPSVNSVDLDRAGARLDCLKYPPGKQQHHRSLRSSYLINNGTMEEEEEEEEEEEASDPENNRLATGNVPSQIHETQDSGVSIYQEYTRRPYVAFQAACPEISSERLQRESISPQKSSRPAARAAGEPYKRQKQARHMMRPGNVSGEFHGYGQGIRAQLSSPDTHPPPDPSKEK